MANDSIDFSTLETEKAYLRDNNVELKKQYPDKYLVLQGTTVCGAYDTYESAITEGVSQLGPGPFLVRSVSQIEDAEVLNVPVLALGMPLNVDL